MRGLSVRTALLGGRSARLTFALVLLCTAGCASAPPRPRASAYVAVLAGLPDVNGRYVEVSAWQGRVLVVQFVASWCFPCIATAPRLQELLRKYGQAGLSVVAVGMDREGAQVLLPFQQLLGLDYPVLLSDSALREGNTAFGRINTLPTTAVVGRDGTLLTAFEGVPTEGSLEAFIDKALAMKP